MPPRLAILVLTLLVTIPARADDQGAQFFESKIRPLLVDQCYSCHSAKAKKLKAKLYLDNRDAALKGGESGPALIPGDPAQSRLIEAINYKNPDLQMPPKDKLSDAQIADLTTWVKMGAPWGKDVTTSVPIARVEAFDLQKRKAAHWAWQPVRPQAPPTVKNTAWPHNPIDQFILAKLEEQHLAPAPPADRRTLIRRLYFDLIGLPPKPQAVEAFLADTSPTAIEKVVDELLASPRFGERWGRHWLDLVRYSETMGHEFDYTIANAWRYRDYVIRAFNQDLPYDQFAIEHIAGDLLKNPRRAQDGTNESVIGTGFWFLGEGTHSPVDIRQWQADTFDNRIDVFGKTFAGLTIACARCHDHKFDAISTADYYALYGHLKRTRYAQTAINDTAIAAAVSQLQKTKDELRRAVADQLLGKLDALVAPPVTALDTAPRPADIELAPPSMEGWRPDGAAFILNPVGDFIVGDDRHPILSVVTNGCAHSGLISRSLEGELRSPTFSLDKRYLHIKAAGQHARFNLVIDNFVIIRDPIYGSLKQILKHDKPTWITIDLKMWQGQQAYLEFADHSVPDPSMNGSETNEWLRLDRALLSDDPKAPREPATQPANPIDLRSTIQLWRDGRLAAAPDAPARAALLASLLDSAPLNSADLSPLIARYREQERSIPAPLYALSAADGPAPPEHIFIRGNPKTPGPEIPRRYLQALSNPQSAIHNPQSRLDLAHEIASPTNPLTARVMANRVWHHLFGRGIVPSVDNFGALGENPSHPELLDYLAADFVQNHWSVKHLIRTIVLSSTYQQSSSDIQHSEFNIQNSLFSHQNIRRLEAEAIRDALLAVSGRLDLTAGGLGVPVHLTSFMEGRGKPSISGPLDGAGRRSIYLDVRRNFLNPMLLAFDTPTPFNTMGRRSVSNVPAQALILMNDPFVHQQAQLWAKKTLADPSAQTPEERITRMYLTAFSRPPTSAELQTLLAFLKDPSDPDPWTALAHALINTKEFIFLN